jgi:hypothetical protein
MHVRPRVSRPVNSRPTEQMRLAVGRCKYILRYVISSGVRVARVSTHTRGKSILGTPANILRRGEKCQSVRKLKWNKRESKHTKLVITRFIHTLIVVTPVSEYTAPPFPAQITHDTETSVAQLLRCCATNRKVACSIPDGVIGIFHWHNPSDRTTALGSTQPLTEMSTRRISWG